MVLDRDELKKWAGLVMAWLHIRRGYGPQPLKTSFTDFMRFLANTGSGEIVKILKQSGFNLEKEFEALETRLKQENEIWEELNKDRGRE